MQHNIVVINFSSYHRAYLIQNPANPIDIIWWKSHRYNLEEIHRHEYPHENYGEEND